MSEVLSSSASVFLEKPGHPYYIVTPKYVRTSAGIKVQHMLCHALNRMGCRAYLVIQPPHPGDDAIHPDLLTPLLTRKIWEHHVREKRTPITIYSETASGNPLKAPCVARFILNFPGLLGGSGVFGEDEYCFSYSENLGHEVPGNRLVLFIPASDPEFFSPGEDGPRSGGCFYAGKYKTFHHCKTFAVTDGMTEITRDMTDSQTPGQIRELFRRSELFYCYENSALAIESVLCHCPVVFIPNQYFTRQIGREELGTQGYAWGTDPQEIEQARRTVMTGRENYLGLFSRAQESLQIFISETQIKAQQTRYDNPVHLPETPLMTTLERAAWLADKIRYHLRNSGIRWTALLVLRRLIRGKQDVRNNRV